VEYNSQCLVSLALYALIKNDDALGQKTARAITNLYRLQKPNIDKFMQFSDSELGSNLGDANASNTQWRGIVGTLAHMDLPFALDFAGKWMTPEDKDFMMRLIGQVTYGRRTNGGDGPRRCWRDINHMTWHMTHYLALTTIEGTPYCDQEALASSEEIVADFLEYGLNKHGTMFESNGKSGAGLLFHSLNMIAMARRGNNLWGHPHWRNLMKSQALNTSPNGKTTVSSGTWSNGALAFPNIMMYHSFYPEDPYSQYLLSEAYGDKSTTLSLSGFDSKTFDLDQYRKSLMKKHGRTRVPGPNTPAFTLTLLYDTDWNNTPREALPKNKTFIDENHGIISAYNKPESDSAWMHMQVRNNHYLGSGHHHADAGMFHFSSGGVNWITESPFQKIYAGKYHNQVRIDGEAQPNGIQGRADWLGSKTGSIASFARADLTQSYSYQIANQFIYFDTDSWGSRPDQYNWELCKDPYIISMFKGTQRYKMRPWWATSLFSNWFPVLQKEANPVQYAKRSAGLIHGDHPYGLLIDDIKKDSDIHLYEWSAMPGEGVWAARRPKDLPDNILLLAHKGTERIHPGHQRIRPRNGDPMLMMVILGGQGVAKEFNSGPSKASKFALNPYGAIAEKEKLNVDVPLRIETRDNGPHWRGGDQVQFFYDQIIGGCYSKEIHFKTLLIPYRHGDDLPKVEFKGDTQTATVIIKDQVDELVFSTNENGQTHFTLRRNSELYDF
jgi:hypothetical protein